MEVSPPPPVPKMPAPPKTIDTKNPTSSNSGRTEKYQEEKISNDYVSTPKRGCVGQTFHGKIISMEVL